MPGAYYPTPFAAPPTSHYQPISMYQPYLPVDSRLPAPIPITHAPSQGHKRLAQPHTESPAKKKQSKWTADEDKSITELRGNGMKWEDISKHLPGRSAISCRLRFQNYLERRPEWDEEKKNKLARLYERFRKDMWEKIAKEMQIPWRAAENMHWQIGEVEMAQRANVSLFQLAGQPPSQAGAMPERVPSTSPPSGNGLPAPMYYSQTHNHSLPHVSHPEQQSISPAYSRMRQNSNGSSQNEHPPRRRADSVTAGPAPMNNNVLPPLGDMVRHSTPPSRYTLPPVMPSSEARGR